MTTEKLRYSDETLKSYGRMVINMGTLEFLIKLLLCAMIQSKCSLALLHESRVRSCLKTPCGPSQGSSKRSVRRAFFIGRDMLEPRLFSSHKGWKPEFSDGFLGC